MRDTPRFHLLLIHAGLEQACTRYFWKIDYYDHQFAMHSPDAAGPARTVKVLTLKRPNEY